MEDVGQVNNHAHGSLEPDIAEIPRQLPGRFRALHQFNSPAVFDGTTTNSFPVFMLRSVVGLSAAKRVLCRTYATSGSPHALVLLEHRGGSIEPSSLAALTAASQLGGEVTGLVIGGPGQVDSIVERAKKCALCFPCADFRLMLGAQLEGTFHGPLLIGRTVLCADTGSRLSTP